MKTSIIIPAYNEEKTLGGILARIQKLRLDKEVIVVDDGSTDDTCLIAEKFKVKLIKHEKNMGKGSAIRTGLKNVTGDIVVIQDADSEYSPEQIPRLIQPIKDNIAEIVFGSRFKGKMENMNIIHHIGNLFLTFATNILYGSDITDMETGHKAFKKEVLDEINLTSKRFEIEPEITAKILKKGYKITEVSTDYVARKNGKTIGVWDGIIAFGWLLWIRFMEGVYENT